MQPPVHALPSRDALMAAAADRIERALREAIGARDAAIAALSGGSTPEPAYAALARRDLDWSKVTLALVDERCVAPNDPASNENMLRRALAPALAQGARLTPMYAEGASPEDAARGAEAHYALLRFDIAVMGMGVDGHTASWFPGAPALAHALDPATPMSVMALRAPGAAGSADRLSLTLSALTRARRVLLLIAGADKRAALEAALAPGSDAPVAALFRAPLATPEVLWAA